MPPPSTLPQVRKPSARHRLLSGGSAAIRAQGKLSTRVDRFVQILSALALLATVIFAYLSWRESRLAREDQATYFVAEKTPRVVLLKVFGGSQSMLAQVRNVGESVAVNVAVEAVQAFPRSDQSQILPERIPLPSVWKGHSTQSFVTYPKGVEDLLGQMSFRELRPLLPEDDKPSAGPFVLNPARQLYVRLSYHDLQGNRYEDRVIFVVPDE